MCGGESDEPLDPTALLLLDSGSHINAPASAAAAPPCPFAFTQSRSRAAVGLPAVVRRRTSAWGQPFAFAYLPLLMNQDLTLISRLFPPTRQHPVSTFQGMAQVALLTVLWMLTAFGTVWG